MNNLAIAFPEKTEQEIKKIAKNFYHQFIDSMLEIVKLISISKKEFEKRFVVNMEIINEHYDTIDRVEVMTGHFFGWEFANLGSSLKSKYPFIVVYHPLSNKIFDKIMYKVRSKFGTILIPSKKFKTHFHPYLKNKYNLILVADQSANPQKAYWLPFFGKMAPFVKGPEKGAKKNNAAVFFTHFYRVKRGYYKADLELITTQPNSFAEGELTKRLIKKVEDSVRQQPAGYLWSHRRWKHIFIEEKHGHLAI
jgi:KDO2-lipid IV(A) lauroyltransferase